ncbi:hypothetical protein Plhal304r1_c037g0112051 [Plasmopara halstedii]
MQLRLDRMIIYILGYASYYTCKVLKLDEQIKWIFNICPGLKTHGYCIIFNTWACFPLCRFERICTAFLDVTLALQTRGREHSELTALGCYHLCISKVSLDL